MAYEFLANNGTTSRVLLGLVFGAMMSVDMGGPVNKAAYVFGTASIAAGNYNIMAALWSAVWFRQSQSRLQP
mgnify:CR=1 FL=1